MKIALIGGHLSPALSVIEHLPKDTNIIFFGRKYGFEKDRTITLEYQEITKRNIPFFIVTSGRLRRTFSWHSLTSPLKLPIGFYQAVSVLKQEKPDVLVGFGGYLSVPIALAGTMLGIPVIHEQTLGAGLANKILAKYASKICLSWEESAPFFSKEKAILTGNPLRLEFLKPSVSQRSKKSDRPLILIMGGSAGSHAINILVEHCLEKLLEKYTIIHQTGAAQEYADFTRLQKKKDALGENLRDQYTCMEFIPVGQTRSLMEQADIIISRSGINTVTELLYLGKPSLLIPLPYGQKDEQLKNALFIRKTGLAEILPQHHATGEKFVDLLGQMMSKLSTYEGYAKTARTLVKEDAGTRIVTVIEDVFQTKKSTNQ